MKPLIIKLENYIGKDTELFVSPNPLYMVVDSKTGGEWDNGYRTYEEAKKSYPKAIN